MKAMAKLKRSPGGMMEIIEPYLLVTGHAHCYLPSFSLKGRRATNMYLLLRITSSDVKVLPFCPIYGKEDREYLSGAENIFLDPH